MFEILPESTEESIGFRVSGRVTAADYDALLPRLDDAILGEAWQWVKED